MRGASVAGIAGHDDRTRIGNQGRSKATCSLRMHSHNEEYSFENGLSCECSFLFRKNFDGLLYWTI